MLVALAVRFFCQPNVILVLVQWSCVGKYSHLHAFSNIFLLFRVPLMPPSPTAPIRTELCPSATIFAIFLQPSQNIMSGEISPAIGPESWSVRPKMSPACLVFVFPVPPTPQSTHPHPSASIYMHL